MRNDMKKVIITPGRYKARDNKYKKYKDRDFEDTPSKEGMSQRYKDRKSFSDFISPLSRLLDKNVNRPWDKVYSEICKEADSRSILGYHLREHVSFLIELNVTIDEDKKVYAYSWGRPHELYKDALYVDPNNGLLRKYTKNTRSWKYDRNQFKKKSIEEKLAHYINTYSRWDAKTKHSIEYKNKKLFKVEWCDGEENKIYKLANEKHAIQDFNFIKDKVRWAIKRETAAIAKSKNPYVKQLARMIKTEEEEKEAAKVKPEDVLRDHKKARKEKERFKLAS